MAEVLRAGAGEVVAGSEAAVADVEVAGVWTRAHLQKFAVSEMI